MPLDLEPVLDLEPESAPSLDLEPVESERVQRGRKNAELRGEQSKLMLEAGPLDYLSTIGDKISIPLPREDPAEIARYRQSIQGTPLAPFTQPESRPPMPGLAAQSSLAPVAPSFAPTVEPEPSADDRQSSAAINTAVKAVESLQTPENLAIMAATIGAGGAGKIGQLIARGIAGTFGIEGAKMVNEGHKALAEAKTPEERGEAIGQMVVGLTMTPALAHAAKPSPVTLLKGETHPFGQKSFIDLAKYAAERLPSDEAGLIDLKARNAMAPGTRRPQEQQTFSAPRPDVPNEMEVRPVPTPPWERQGFFKEPLAPSEIKVDFEPPKNKLPEPTKTETETRGKLGFGAEAGEWQGVRNRTMPEAPADPLQQTINRIVNRAQEIGLTRSAEAAAEVKPTAPKLDLVEQAPPVSEPAPAPTKAPAAQGITMPGYEKHRAEPPAELKPILDEMGFSYAGFTEHNGGVTHMGELSDSAAGVSFKGTDTIDQIREKLSAKREEFREDGATIAKKIERLAALKPKDAQAFGNAGYAERVAREEISKLPPDQKARAMTRLTEAKAAIDVKAEELIKRLQDESLSKDEQLAIADELSRVTTRGNYFKSAIDIVNGRESTAEQVSREVEARAKIAPAEPEAAPATTTPPAAETPAAAKPGVEAAPKQEPGPGLIGMGAATPANIPAPSKVKVAFARASKPVAAARAAVSKLWTSRKIKEAMTATRDAGENQANVFAKQMGNEVRGPLRREFGKEQTLAEDALTAVVESGSTREGIQAGLDKLQNVQHSNPLLEYWRRKAIDAHEFALYNFDKLKPVADRYRELTKEQMDAERAAGIDTLERDNYVMHAQDVSEPLDAFSGGSGDSTSFRKIRTHDTYADSITAGVEPRSLNAVDLLETRLRAGQGMLNRKAWGESLARLTDADTGNPISAPMVRKTRADGSFYMEPPEGYSQETLGDQPIAIQKGYEGVFSALTDPSAFQKSMGARNLMRVNAAGKSINLMLDTFHLGRLAMWANTIKAAGVSTFQMPTLGKGLWKKGQSLLDHTPQELQKMAAAGEIPQHYLADVLENKRKIDGLVSAGYNIGRVADALHNDLIHSIPALGTFNKWLFQSFQRGAMVQAGLLELRRLQEARPDMPEPQAMRQVAKALNTRFGNLGRQGIFKSRTFQDIARLVFLAPQWNEGLIRSELGAVKDLGSLVADTAQGKRFYVGTQLRTAGIMALTTFIGNQIINLATRGKPTWENPEKEAGAKISAYIPDAIGSGPGFFLHPYSLAAETTHLLQGRYEKTGDAAGAVRQYLRGRSSAIARPLATFATRQDPLGRTLRPDEVYQQMLKDILPTPIGASAVGAAGKQLITGEPSEVFPGQFQKQVLASAGVKVESAPSQNQRTQNAARKFNEEKGIKPSAEFFAGDYEKLSNALRVGNKTEAKKELADLMRKKTGSDIAKHYKKWLKAPFTGQAAREREFYGTLSDEEKQAYDRAREERLKVVESAIDLLSAQ